MRVPLHRPQKRSASDSGPHSSSGQRQNERRRAGTRARRNVRTKDSRQSGVLLQAGAPEFRLTRLTLLAPRLRSGLSGTQKGKACSRHEPERAHRRSPAPSRDADDRHRRLSRNPRLCPDAWADGGPRRSTGSQDGGGKPIRTSSRCRRLQSSSGSSRPCNRLPASASWSLVIPIDEPAEPVQVAAIVEQPHRHTH